MYTWVVKNIFVSDRTGHVASLEDIEYYESLKKEREYSQRELLEIFPEAVAYFKERLKELKGLAIEKDDETRSAVIRQEECGLCDRWFYEMCAENRREEYEKLRKEIVRIQWIINPRPKDISSVGITDGDIQAAKSTPLSDFIQVNYAGFARCPFHEEKTGSFKLFKDNRWWCFGGCSIGGDSIDFVMKKHNVDFIEAVKMLIRK